MSALVRPCLPLATPVCFPGLLSDMAVDGSLRIVDAFMRS